MKALFKYAIVLALGLAVGIYVRGPLNLEDLAKFKWFDEINVTINKAFVLAKPEAAGTLVDPAAAALIDEQLDYRIAQRIGSLEGWRSFLAAHGSGVHAQSARAEVEKLLLAGKAPAPAAAEVSNGGSTDAKAGSEVVGSAPPSPRTEVAALTPDEICIRDERLRNSPTSDEAARFANELGCEKLRPQLLDLMGSLGYAASTPLVAVVSNGAPTHAKAGTEVVGSAPRFRGTKVVALASLGYAAPPHAAAPPNPSVKVRSTLGPKPRATAPPSRTLWTASSRRLQPRRHARNLLVEDEVIESIEVFE